MSGIEESIRERTRVDPSRFTKSDSSGKFVLGVPGTPLPNNPKPDLIVVFVLSGESSRIVFADDFQDEIQRKVRGRGFDQARVEYLRSGESSAKPFREQAVSVRMSGENLPVTEGQLDEVAGVVARAGPGVTLKERVFEVVA